MFDTDFIELASRITGNEQGKGRGKISLSEFLDMAARHRTQLFKNLLQRINYTRQ